MVAGASVLIHLTDVLQVRIGSTDEMHAKPGFRTCACSSFGIEISISLGFVNQIRLRNLHLSVVLEIFLRRSSLYLDGMF